MSKPVIDIRAPKVEDLASIIALLANDPLGEKRERFELPLPTPYQRAFEAIQSDPNNRLIVAGAGEQVVGVLQLTLIPNLTYVGSWRGQIEGVRVSHEARGKGVGRRLVREAIQQARDAGCRLVQLTTDKKRPDAIEFYRSLGFVPSHEGMKLSL